MRIAIVTDAWHPQTNGVVTSLRKTGEHLESMGHTVLFVTPEGFRTIGLPTYRSIRLALFPGRRVAERLARFVPDAVHIATEGPLGLAARRWCLRNATRFTTSYHTQFPQYVRLRAPVPVRWSYAFLRWFHGPAERTMVPTPAVQRELTRWGLSHVVIWSRGVDTELFRPRPRTLLSDPRPIAMYVGRVAVEKNIEAFAELELPGTKYVVGDGPDREALARKYPGVRFTGFKFGDELAQYMAEADVFVFPSRTDTFGLVMLEAMACGVPVAAYPVTGPVDVVRDGETGALDEDLGRAVARALTLDGRAARRYALEHSWAVSTKEFFCHLAVNHRRADTAPESCEQRQS